MTPRQTDFFRELLAPFPLEAHYARLQGGRTVLYIRARTIMNRLDDVAGPSGWTSEFTETAHGQKCRLKILCPDNTEEGWTWHYKDDGAGTEAMGEDNDNAEKSSFTNAFRRAAVQWGFARYLYNEGMPNYLADLFVGLDEALQAIQPAASNYPRRDRAPAHTQRATAPTSPGYATAPAYQERATAPAGQRQQALPSGNFDPSIPPTRPGRACYAWCRQLGDRYQTDLVKVAQTFTKTQFGVWRSDELDEVQLLATTGHIIEYCRRYLPTYDGLFDGGNGR